MLQILSVQMSTYVYLNVHTYVQIHVMYLSIFVLQKNVTTAQSETVQNVAVLVCRRMLRGLVTQAKKASGNQTWCGL